MQEKKGEDLQQVLNKVVEVGIDEVGIDEVGKGVLGPVFCSCSIK